MSSVLFAALFASSCVRPEPIDKPEIKVPKARVRDVEEAAGLLAQKMSISLVDRPLGEVLRSITVLTGVDIIVHPEIMSTEEIEEKRVTIQATDMPLRHVLDWIVRQIGTNYQLKDDGSIWITAGYMPVDKLETDSFFVPLLYLDEAEKDLIAILKASILPVTLKRSDVDFVPRVSSNLMVVRAPLPVLKRVRDIVNALGETSPPPPVPLVEESREILERRILCTHGWIALPDIVRRIKDETGLNIGYRNDLVKKKEVQDRVDMSMGYVTVREVLDRLVSSAGFDRWEWESGRRIWLYSRKESGYPPSFEAPWSTTIVRAYPIGSLTLKKTPEEIEREVRAVCGKPSPATVVKYSAATGKLLVIDEPDVLRHVEEYLKMSRLLLK